MATKKISELTALTTPDGAEELVVNDGGTSKKITVDNIFNQDIDVTGTVTADGLTVDDWSIDGTYISNSSVDNTGIDVNAHFRIDIDNDNNHTDRQFYVTSNNGAKVHLNVQESGDISFYEDTGTTAKLFWDASAEGLGIGTSSPGYQLDVQGTTEKNYARIGDVYNNSFTTETAVLGLYGDTLNNGAGPGLFFAAGVTTSAIYSTRQGNGTGGDLRFHTRVSGTVAERMRIDSSGNVLVGTTATGLLADTSGEGVQIAPDNIQVLADGSPCLYLNRLSSDGDIVDFRKDGTTVGGIGVKSSQLYIETPSKSGLIFANNYIYPSSAGAVHDDDISLGISTSRFKDLYLSGGVYLGGTGSANKLEDYEEGTWTATMTSGSVTADRTTYTKVGRLVTVQARLSDITDYTTAASVYVQGLPFTASSTSGSHIGALMCRYLNVGRSSLAAQVATSTTTFALVGYDSDNSANWHTLQYADATAPWDVHVSLTYYTDS